MGFYAGKILKGFVIIKVTICTIIDYLLITCLNSCSAGNFLQG